MIQNAIKGISMFVFCYSALYQTDRKFSSFAFLEKNYTQKPPTPPPHPPQKTPSSTKVPKASRKEKFQRETKILRLSPSLKLRSTGVPTPPPAPTSGLNTVIDVWKSWDSYYRTVAVTQLQPTDARRTFPCFDEPSLKAKFTVTLAHDPSMISISNMPIKSQETVGEWQLDHFEETPIMPTYLLAFVVCDFKHKTVTTSGGKNVSEGLLKTRWYHLPVKWRLTLRV